MRPELLQKFFWKKKGVERCIALLQSTNWATTTALDFVRLVRSEHSQEGDEDDEMRLSESISYRKLLLEAFESSKYEEVEEYTLNALSLSRDMEGIESDVAVEPSPFADVFKTSRTRGMSDEEISLTSRFHQAEGISSVPMRPDANIYSSGTGKSRALIELKNQGAIVLYINLRSKNESGNPFPDRDDVPARILTEGLDCSEKAYSRRCTAILTALLQLLNLCLLELREKCNTREEIVMAWSEKMCNMGSNARSEFFANLDQAYQEVRQGRYVLPKASTAKSSATNQQLTEKEYSALPMTPSSSTESARKDPPQNPQQNPQKVPDDSPRVYGESAMKFAFDALVATLPEIFETSSNSPSVVVAIDEAHPLCERQEPFSPSHILTRAISTLSLYKPNVPFWFVFASTASKVADFSAPADLHASSRIQIGGKWLFPPYYHFGWDQQVRP
ncbi:hypothetical protein FS749_005549 [Ceratobasidium sp. UAMH 11750]|nr:hypothetical protein FS749_005549 [Ceratobasidium sp. UAMH 11750]